MQGIETVTISGDGIDPVTMTGKEFADLPEKIRRNGRAAKGGAEPPRTTVAKLLEDVAQILEESLPPFEASLEATDHELPASITVKIAFVPAKPDTDTKVGDPAKIVVAGKLALPTTAHEHDASVSGGQLALL